MLFMVISFLLLASCAKKIVEDIPLCSEGFALINDECCEDQNLNEVCDVYEVPEQPDENIVPELLPAAENRSLLSHPIIDCWYWQSTWSDGANHYGQSCIRLYSDMNCTTRSVVDGHWSGLNGTFILREDGENTVFQCALDGTSKAGIYYPNGTMYYKSEYLSMVVEGYVRIHLRHVCNELCN